MLWMIKYRSNLFFNPFYLLQLKSNKSKHQNKLYDKMCVFFYEDKMFILRERDVVFINIIYKKSIKVISFLI